MNELQKVLLISKQNDVSTDILKRNLQVAGYQFRNVTPGDGNCFFHAIVDQLYRVEDDIEDNYDKLRQRVVAHLDFNRHQNDGTDRFSFVEGYQSWEDYIQKMKKDGTWVDHLVVMATAEVLGREIWVYSSSPDGEKCGKNFHKIRSPRCSRRNPLLVAHFHESHYQSIEEQGTKHKLSDDETEGPKAKVLKETKITNCQGVTVIDSVNAPGGNISIHSNTSNQGEMSSPFDNMVVDTRNRIEKADPKKHVSTYAERSARRLLKQSGAIFIKGISGSGKTTLALNLLAAIAKEEQRLPILLSLCKQWDDIPKKSDQEGHTTVKYVVMIDDIFGDSNLVQSQVDEWVKLFDTMLPYLESGDMKLVITSRPEISHRCDSKIKKYRLIQNMTSFALHEGRYALRKNEKITMVKMICGNVQKFTKFELDMIAQMDTTLGFPQCCHMFADSSHAQKRGIGFFHNPKAFVLKNVKELDGVGHLVLLIVLMKDGCLAKKLLNCNVYPNELKPLVEKVKECCIIESVVTLAIIREKAVSLCGVYLIDTGKAYEFQHQSIHDCVFTHISNTYPELAIGLCPVKMLLELVRTQKDDTDIEMVCLEEDRYDLLADRITKLLLSENYKNILYHPSLHHDQFVNFLLEKWMSENKLQDVIKYKHEPKTVKVDVLRLLGPIVMPTTLSIFDYTYLSEEIILRKLGLMTKCLINDSKINDKDLLSCLLVCAVYIEDNNLVQNLLRMGAETSMACYRAMFHAKGIDKTVTGKILLECELGAMPDLGDLFSLAVQRGNIHVVKLVVTTMKGSRKGDMCRTNLRLLLSSMAKHLSFLSTVFKNYMELCIDPATLSELIKILYSSSEPKDDVNYLVWLSASHMNATALKEFLTFSGINLHKKPDTNDVSDHDGPYQSCFHKTTFELALAHGGTDCVEELISYHARTGGSVEELVNHKSDKPNQAILKLLFFVSHKPRSSFTYPLHMTAKYGKADNMKLLIQNGANVNITDSDDQTALCISIKYRNVECFKVLLQANVSLTEKDKNGKTPFARLYELAYIHKEMNLVKCQNESVLGIVECFVNSGCDINERDSDGRNCISKAVLGQDEDTVRFLCENGASVNERDDQGNTLLQIASKQFDMDMVKFLCTMGANTDAVNCMTGKSVIHMAAASKNDAIDKLQYFLDVKGVNVATLDNQGRTALFDAVESGDKEVVQLLEERGLPMKQRDNTGETLLHVACKGNWSLDVINMIIDAGVKPEDVDQEERNTALKARNIAGETPLHLALYSKSGALADILIQKGADPCVKDNFGNTSLHLAARDTHNDTSLIDMLIQKGADKDLKNQDGITPLHCAADEGCSSIMERLLMKGADPCVKDNFGNTPLHLAARDTHNDTSLIDMLIQKGADKNLKNQDGRTPLHCAADEGCLFIVIHLLVNGADPCVKDNRGSWI